MEYIIDIRVWKFIIVNIVQLWYMRLFLVEDFGEYENASHPNFIIA